MPMRLFLCAGEPSGDLHGASLIRSLRRLQPDLELVGFGGDRMAAKGCRLLYPLCHLAVMWVARVLANAPTFLRLVSEADRYFRQHRPDAVVLIDYPGFNWWMARRAHFHGIPVFYFVPPQLWAWAGWRVEKMRRFVDHVLCTLPFEQPWYHERGVAAHYVGHPYFDELSQQQLDAQWLADQASDGPVVGLLPGSRTQEIHRNLSTLVRAAQRVHAARPDARFLVACYKPAQQQLIDTYLRDQAPLPIQTFVGRTPEIIARSRTTIAVSGSVGLELLYHGKPSVVLYRVGKFDLWVCKQFKTSRFISLVNLLAEKELFPEFLTDHCEAAPIAEQVLTWLNDPAAYAAACTELAELRSAWPNLEHVSGRRRMCWQCWRIPRSERGRRDPVNRWWTLPAESHRQSDPPGRAAAALREPDDAAQTAEQHQGGGVGMANAKRLFRLAAMKDIEHHFQTAIADDLPGKIGLALGDEERFLTLNQMKDVRLLIEEGHHGVHVSHQLGAGGRGRGDRMFQSLHDLLGGPAQQSIVQGFLVAEVAIQRPLADAGGDGDVLHAHLVGNRCEGTTAPRPPAFCRVGREFLLAPGEYLAKNHGTRRRSGFFLLMTDQSVRLYHPWPA